jgi:hypothetical protein
MHFQAHQPFLLYPLDLRLHCKFISWILSLGQHEVIFAEEEWGMLGYKRGVGSGDFWNNFA